LRPGATSARIADSEHPPPKVERTATRQSVYRTPDRIARLFAAVDHNVDTRSTAHWALVHESAVERAKQAADKRARLAHAARGHAAVSVATDDAESRR